MFKDPDDVFGPGDEMPQGRVIDVTPRKKKDKGGIDFGSDQPVLEQMLEEHKLDRTDKRPAAKPGWFRSFLFYFLVFMVVLSAFMVIYYFFK